MLMTPEEKQLFGECVRKARVAKGWNTAQLLVSIARIDPTTVTSEITLKRMEAGGLLPSERTTGRTAKDTLYQARVRDCVAKSLGLATPESGAYSVSANVVAAPTIEAPTIEAPAIAAPQKSDGRKRNTFKAALAAVAEKRAKKKTGAVDTGAAPKMVKFYTSLTTEHGFSMGAIRATLRQLNALGISTEEVRASIKSRFAQYIDSLEV